MRLKIGLLVVAALLIGCSDDSRPSSRLDGEFGPDAPIRVTATVGMVADLVRNVGGDRVTVTQICGSGVDPHVYQTTRDDVLALRDADVVFYCGLMLEGQMTGMLEQQSKQRPVIAVAESLDLSQLIEPDGGSGHPDPHVWMDVASWSGCLDVIVERLSDLDAAGAETFQTNAEAYRAELEQLHRYGSDRIASIPKDRRVLVTSHDAFNYFGRAYDLEVIGVQGISTESEAGLKRINDLVDTLVDRNIQSVFVESSVSAANIRALVEGAQSRGHTVAIAPRPLYSDAMGPAGTYRGTYIGMLDHNITEVTLGLGGDAPQAGMNDRLTP